MTRPRPSFLRRYSLNWRCKKKGVAATSHLKTTPPLFFFLPFLKKSGSVGIPETRYFFWLALVVYMILANQNVSTYCDCLADDTQHVCAGPLFNLCFERAWYAITRDLIGRGHCTEPSSQRPRTFNNLCWYVQSEV